MKSAKITTRYLNLQKSQIVIEHALYIGEVNYAYNN